MAVTAVTEEAPGIRALHLQHLDGRPFTPFRAGAHVDVLGPTGVLRQYSLASDPHDPSALVIAVKLEPESRGSSAALHRVAVGDRLEIGEPRNLIGIVDGADRHLLVAGGVGVTPLLAMAYDLDRRGEDFHLHYVARSRESAAFVRLLESDVAFTDRVSFHFGIPRDEHPGLFASILTPLSRDSHVYTCGPDGFMSTVAEAAGPVVGEDHVHIEHFTAIEVDTTGDTPFTVELDTGEVFEVPADRSVLEVLEENGVEVFKSCTEGICGSCVSGVLDGTPDHRDQCLSAADKAANKEMALCVSRALTERLVIELY